MWLFAADERFHAVAQVGPARKARVHPWRKPWRGVGYRQRELIHVVDLPPVPPGIYEKAAQQESSATSQADPQAVPFRPGEGSFRSPVAVPFRRFMTVARADQLTR